MSLPKLDAFTRAYLECALWTSEACKPYGEAYVMGPETNDQGGCDDAQWDAWDGVIYIQD